MSSSEKLIVIDGNALVHRAWHALPPLQTKSGKIVNAVYGFMLIFLKVLKDLKPTHCVVTFDLPGPTFRHEQFAEYKATRVKQPDELYAQIPILKEALQAFRVPVVEAEGFEADDVIGTISAVASKAALPTIIVTGDLDTLQLVDDHTRVYTLKKGLTDTVVYDAAAVKERYGLNPDELVEYRALRGDPSDNIPGVKGVGEKTAAALIKKFGTIADLYENLEKSKIIKPPLTPRLKEILLQHKKEAMMSRELSEIIRDVPLKISLDNFRAQEPDSDRVVKLFQELGFKSLLGKIPSLKQASLRGRENSPETDVKYLLVDNKTSFDSFFNELKRQDTFVFDTETTDLNPFAADLLGISFCWRVSEAYYVVADGHSDFLQSLTQVLEDEKIMKWGHNLKYDIEVLSRAGIKVRSAVGDTMIASYLLNPGSRAHALDTLAFTEFGHRMIPITNLIGEKKPQKPMRDVPLKDLSDYSCEDADYTLRLKEKFEPELAKAGLDQLFRDIEMPLVPVLAGMEEAGIKVDTRVLSQIKRAAALRLAVLEKQIHEQAGEEFNIASPQQLKVVLFEKLKISSEGIGKTKTGLSTAAMELEKIKGVHPIIELIIEHRELSKLISTYLDALPELIDRKTNRLHTSFNQTVTATGRLSSSEPNLQNIPVRTELGREVRRAFVAEKGAQLVSADYSQIELRIVASLSQDKTMLDIFRRHEDIHTATAATIHGVAPDHVTPEMRYAAKEVNFGVMYGMGPWGLAARTGLSREEAQEFIAKYFQAFSAVKEYLEQTKVIAKSLGYVETLFGRRRYLPEIKSGVAQVRAAAERMAINMPIQGTAADLMKLAMIRVYQGLEAFGAEVKLVLQVHDELVLEVPVNKIKKVAMFVKEEMETVVKLKAPIEVHLKVGENWGKMQSLRI